MTDAAESTALAKSGRIVTALAQAVIKDDRYGNDPLEALSLVVELDGQAGMFGYNYGLNGKWWAQSPDDFELLDIAEDLRNSMTREKGVTWKACLLQIKRPSMKMSIDFEYDDASRWQVTPGNLEARVEELRPLP